MKYIYLLPIILFSCSDQKEKDKQLIEFNEKLNEKNEIIQKQSDSINILNDEFNNCKLNYKALKETAYGHPIK